MICSSSSSSKSPPFFLRPSFIGQKTGFLKCRKGSPFPKSGGDGPVPRFPRVGILSGFAGMAQECTFQFGNRHMDFCPVRELCPERLPQNGAIQRMTGMFNRSSVALSMLEMRGWVQPTFLAISDWDSPAPTRMDMSVRATMLLLYRASDPATTSAESIGSTSSSTVLPDRHSFLVDD